MLDIGRIAIKTAGREAGHYCIIIDKIDDKYVLVTGPKILTKVKRRRCSIEHLEPTPEIIKIKPKASDAEVLKAYEKADLYKKLKLKKPSAEKIKVLKEVEAKVKVKKEIKKKIEKPKPKVKVIKPEKEKKVKPEKPEKLKEVKEKLKVKKEVRKAKRKTKAVDCVYLKKSGKQYKCGSPRSRQHGLLGNTDEAKEKCEKCHVRVAK